MMDVTEKEGQKKKAGAWVQFYMVQLMAGSEEEERKSGGGSKPNGIETKVFS